MEKLLGILDLFLAWLNMPLVCLPSLALLAATTFFIESVEANKGTKHFHITLEAEAGRNKSVSTKEGEQWRN